MSLKDQRILIVDAQTTGMRPPRGQLLELAWCFTDARSEPEVHTRRLRLPQGHSIPKTVSEITGLKDEDDVPLFEPAEVAKEILFGLGDHCWSVIHYAQFEIPFMKDLLGDECVQDIEFLCSQKLTKALFPDLPSQNLRAVAGHFGAPVSGLNRAGPFALGTFHIWQGLVGALEERGLTDMESVRTWLLEAAKPKKTRYTYRMSREQRLALPSGPGVYRMLSKTGEILYVGKATSLRSRVNSYFRGQKNRDRKKLEMLAQVWDLRVTETRSPLEAALLETDEIKRFDPPYNLLLKTKNRKIVFYRRDFSDSRTQWSEEFRIGPFRAQNWIESIRLIELSLLQGEFEQIFFDFIEPDLLRAGWDIFIAGHGLPPTMTARQMIATSVKLYRKLGEPVKPTEDADTEDEATTAEELSSGDVDESEAPPTPEEFAAKFERLFRRAGAEWKRHRELTRLLNARVAYRRKTQEFTLFISDGKIDLEPNNAAATKTKGRWSGLSLDTFDRMSILLSELGRTDHKIQFNR
jgi:DNA polymerase-3 subunit epsilon